MLDVSTGCKYSEPVDTMDAAETARVLQHLRGDDYIYRVYSDNHRSLRKTCQMLGVMWEASQPGVHQTNARVERCNQDVLEGSWCKRASPRCVGRMRRVATAISATVTLGGPRRK